jgi:hypothetical protein
MLLTSGCISLVAVLYLFVPGGEAPGHFTRNFQPALHLVRIIPLRERYNHVSGVSNHTLYFSNTKKPFTLLRYSLMTQETSIVAIESDHFITEGTTYVLNDYFYITGNDGKIILRGRINDWQAELMIDSTSRIFDALPYSQASFAARTFLTNKNEFTLARISPVETERFPMFLEKQIDGIFCTDGMLVINHEQQRILYVYYYRNQFICVDTAFSLQYKGRTLDDYVQARIEVTEVTSDHSITVIAPLGPVNAYACSYGEWLFVHSTIRSSNEEETKFKVSSTIDVYAVGNGRYAFSFYIPSYKHERMRAFAIAGSQVIVLYSSGAVVYELESTFTSY